MTESEKNHPEPGEQLVFLNPEAEIVESVVPEKPLDEIPEERVALPTAPVPPPAAAARAITPKRKFSLRWMLIAVAAGLFGMMLGGWVVFLYTNGYQARWQAAAQQLRMANQQLADANTKLPAAETKIKNLESDLEKAQFDLSNLKLGMSQLNKVFSDETKPPDTPNYIKMDKGIFVYWMDGILWRHYYLYKSKGTQALSKNATRASKENFVVFKNLKPGVWNFAVSAIDRQGRETNLSKTLSVTITKQTGNSVQP